MRYRFAGCVLDTERYTLERDGAEVPVEPQVFDLLTLLARKAGKLVSRDELIATVWNGRVVSEAAISARINAARTAVGDTGKAQSVLRTVPRRGFELVALVERLDDAAPRAAPSPRQTIRFSKSRDGTGIAYAQSGRGPKVLRAGHFLTHLEQDWDSAVWRPYLDALSAEFSLVRYDQRGTGLSDRDLRGTDVQDYCDDLLAVADAAGLERFPLIASSQGVPTSIRFAASHTDRVACLVLYGGFARGRAKRGDQSGQEEANALIALIKAGWGDPKSAFMAAFTTLFCPGASREELDNLAEIQIASSSAENAARIRTAIDHFDVVADLAKISVPTLVIHASKDGVHPISQGRLLASGIQNAEFLTVESSNHIYLPSDPSWQRIVNAQIEFVRRYASD